MSDQDRTSARNDIKRLLARNTVWNYLGFAVNVLANLALLPLVVAHVGEDAAGIWLLLGSLTSYMGLLELGIVPSLTQHVAAALGTNAREEVDRAVSTALVVLSGMMLLALQSVWFVPWLVGLLDLPGGLEREARLAIAVTLAAVAVRMPLAVFQAVLLGCQRQDRCNQLWIALALTKTLATLGLLWLGFGVVGIVVMEAAAHLLAGVLQIRWVKQELPALRIAWSLANQTHATAIVGLGGTVLAMNLCALVVEQTDRLVIGIFLPVSQVTHYAAAWKLYMLGYSVPTILLQAVAPVAARLHGQGDDRALRELLLRMTKYSAALALPLSLALGLTSGTLMQLWMGPAFADARPLVQVLLVAFGVTAFNHAGYAILLGMRRIGGLLPLYYVPLAVLNLTISLLLVQSLGTLGVALGTALPALALEYVFVRYVCRITGVTVGQFLGRAVGPAVWPLVTFTPAVAAYLWAGPESIALLPIAFASFVAYEALFWSAGLDMAERKEMVGLVRTRSWRAMPAQS